MAKYYVFDDDELADSCVYAIKYSGWFPRIGYRDGHPDPSAQASEEWVRDKREMREKNDEDKTQWGVLGVPSELLDEAGVPLRQRIDFLKIFGQDVRDLEETAFVFEDDQE